MFFEFIDLYIARYNCRNLYCFGVFTARFQYNALKICLVCAILTTRFAYYKVRTHRVIGGMTLYCRFDFVVRYRNY